MDCVKLANVRKKIRNKTFSNAEIESITEKVLNNMQLAPAYHQVRTILMSMISRQRQNDKELQINEQDNTFTNVQTSETESKN